MVGAMEADMVAEEELTLAGVAEEEVASEPPLVGAVAVDEHLLVAVEVVSEHPLVAAVGDEHPLAAGAEFEPLRVVGLLQEYVRHQADPRFDRHHSASRVLVDNCVPGTPERVVAISAEPEHQVCARVLQVSTRVAFTRVGLASTPAQVVFERAVLVFKQVAFGPVSAILVPVALVREWELVPEESVARVRWATPDADN